jgi:hypothetical protein
LRARAWRQIEPPPERASAYATPEQRDAGYLWAGQEVARNSDVIIAIWDDQPFRGKGGTADLIRWLRAHDAENGPEPDPDEPVLEEVWPLRIIVHVGGDGEPYVEVDNAPPYNAAAEAAQKRLREDLAGLNDFNHKHYRALDSLVVEPDVISEEDFRKKLHDALDKWVRDYSFTRELVNHSAEFQRTRRRLLSLSERTGGAALIFGEPGTGKTVMFNALLKDT